MTKRERDEQRRIDAIRRMRLMHLCGMLLHIQVSWEHGFVGGGQAWGAKYAPVDLAGGRLGMAKILWHKLNKARMDMFDAFGMAKEFEKCGKSFFRDSDNAITNLNLEVIRALPPEASYTEGLICSTYLVYAMLHDLRILENDQRPELEKLVRAFGSFADWLLPKDSPLVEPMNKVYWACRDGILCTPDWTRGGELEWGESEQDKYLREKEKEKAA